jgi:hypothetical protein
MQQRFAAVDGPSAAVSSCGRRSGTVPATMRVAPLTSSASSELVRDRMIKIRQFIDGWNDCKHPLSWIKTADDILDKITVFNTGPPKR